MDPLKGNYDATFRFVRALLSVALQSQRAEQLFIEHLLTPTQDYYSSKEKKICLKLWRFSRTIPNTAAVQRCLMGVKHDDVGDIDSPWSTNQVVDVAALFKYIDIDTNNWFWLDVIASFPTATDESVGTRMSTTPTYGIKKKYVNELLRKTIEPEYRKLFQSEVLYFRIHNAVRVVFDTARRLFHSNSYKEAVMFIVNDNISRLPTYDYLDASPAKVQALRGDSYELLDRLGGEVLQTAPSMKNWLEDETEGIAIRVIISDTTAIQITVRANMRLLEAALFEVFLYECVVSQNVPKRERLVRVGRLFTDTSDIIVRDTFLVKILVATHKTPIYTKTVYDMFHACCCDYVAFHKTVSFDSLKRTTHVATDKLTAFNRLYTIMSMYYDTEIIADIMKSVCLLVTTPAIAHALYTVMMPSPVYSDDGVGDDRRMIVFSSLLGACRGVESSMSWIEATYRNRLLCAPPHTISDSDVIYPVSVLARAALL
jgi:hypothetical protein